VLLVPNTALVRGENGTQVRRLKQDSSIELVSIEGGYSDGFQTIVTRGLAAGEAILARPDQVAP
jgi:hypothetical protein